MNFNYITENLQKSLSPLRKNKKVYQRFIENSPPKHNSCKTINKAYNFIIKPGNNKELIKTILLQRQNWKEAPSDLTTAYNFKWSNTKKKIEYCLLSRNSINPRVNIKYYN